MNINQENLINDPTDSFITNPHGLAGDRNQEWKNVLKKVSQKLIEYQIPHIGEIMGDLAYELKNIKRTDFPIFLDPKTATFIEVAIHAKIRQYLADSTIEKNLRYARFMETHPCPINFRNLTPENFIQHMDYRLELEDPPATAYALENEKKSLVMFLRAYGISDKRWTTLVRIPPRPPTNDAIEVPFPETVNKFVTAHVLEAADSYSKHSVDDIPNFSVTISMKFSFLFLDVSNVLKSI